MPCGVDYHYLNVKHCKNRKRFGNYQTFSEKNIYHIAFAYINGMSSSVIFVISAIDTVLS